MKYTKHNVIRNKDLTDNYFEIIFARDKLLFGPGSVLELKSIERGDRHPLFIASEPTGGWVRIIVDKRDYPELHQLKAKDTLKVCATSTWVDIHASNQGFIVAGVGVGPLFSLISTLPQQKQDVVYLGDERISVEYLRKQHAVSDELTPLQDDKTYYVIGRRATTPLPEGLNVVDCRYGKGN